jgi:hypothetical protein
MLTPRNIVGLEFLSTTLEKVRAARLVGTVTVYI